MRHVLATAFTVIATPVLAQDCTGDERPFEHHLGTTYTPETPQRIASLRGDQTTTPLLDMDAPIALTVMNRMGTDETYVRGAGFPRLDSGIEQFGVD